MSLDLLSLLFFVVGISILALIGFLLVVVHREERRALAQASKLLRQGLSLEQSKLQLVAEGIDLETASNAVRLAKEQAIIASVPGLLSSGASKEEAQEHLTTHGFDKETAVEVVAELAHGLWRRRHPVASVSLGMALLLIGVAVIVGGFILVFALKAKQLELFPYAEEIVVIILDLLAACVIVGAIALASSRVVVRFGMVTLAIGFALLVFGFINLAEPTLRIYAPLGLFVSAAGGGIIYYGHEFPSRSVPSLGPESSVPRETQKVLKSDTDLLK